MRGRMKRRILAWFLCFTMIFSLTMSTYAEKSEIVEELPHVTMRLASDSNTEIARANDATVVASGSNAEAIASDSNSTFNGCEDCGLVEGEGHAENCITKCTCLPVNGVHQENCELYVAPLCDCGTTSRFHSLTCAVYVEPITADVYTERDGVYTLIELHNENTPIQMKDYNKQIIYVLENEKPQNLYFEQKTDWGLDIVGTYFVMSDTEEAILSTGGALWGASKAVVTLAGGIAAETQIELNTHNCKIIIEVLDGIPESNPEVVEKVTEVNGTKILTSGKGIPENVSLKASAILEDSYHEHLGTYIEDFSKLLFAFDITLMDSEGDIWQPAEGEKVTVTLDVSRMGADDGSKIGIVHDHEGTLSKLGEYTVKDGKISFETKGFSVFYGYTVDFEYNGTWHSIGGGSYIYLSELFEMLGIERSVNKVSDVTFSDDTLIAITHLNYIEEQGGGQDWRLSSLEPFDSEEVLTITFDDGEQIVINVYDKNWGTENIDENEAWANNDTHGNRKVTANSTITVDPGAIITLNGTITIPEGSTLTIQCSGNATLKRGSSNTADVPLFNVDGGKLVIQSTGGKITVDGSGIAVGRAAFLVGISKNGTDNGGSTLELTNVAIQNCYSNNDGYAGAIHTTSGGSTYSAIYNITMNNCVINNCRAPHGSAIYFNGSAKGKATITNTVIKNCIAYGKTEPNGDDQGGTIRSNGNHGGFVVFERCIFQDNLSGYDGNRSPKSNSRCYGGAIYWNAAGSLSTNYPDTIDSTNDRAKMYIYDCQILDNKATNRGGGIFNEQAMYIGTRHSSGFSNTRVSDTSGIKGTLIDGNYAGGYTGNKEGNINCGGGIMVPTYGGGADESKDMNVTLNMGEGVFVTNNKSENGGGLAMQINKTEDKNDGVTFAINYNGAVIQNNTASENGGGVFIVMSYAGYNSDLNLISGEISENKAQNGGGIYVENTNINIGTDATTAENPIKIKDNTASDDGGGIYLKQEQSYANTVLINVSNGFVTGNTSTGNGGGIYQTGAIGNCVVTGEGKIGDNTAANGGGIYIADGSKLSVTGGIITDNHAVGSSDAATAKEATCGVGGGIYVHTGEFSMSGDYVGLHSNDASVAANDAYATGGTATKLTLPNVEAMNLAGWSGTGQPEGWFADYKADDPNYPSDVIVVDDGPTTNSGRYNYYDEDNVEVDYTNVLSKNTNTYYCLTIGTPHPGYGNLVITKTLTAPAKEDQTFIFEVTGITRKPETDYSLTVTLVIKKDETTAQVLVANIPDGTYTVTEKEAWSWRYTQTSRQFHPKDGAVISETTFTVAIEKPEWVADFTNSRTNPFWLSGDSYCKNWWGGNDGTVVAKREEDE